MNKIEAIKASVDKAATKLAGPLGFGFYDAETGKSYYHNGDKLFPTASIFKIFVLAELYRKVYNGELSLCDRHELTEEMKSPGSGVMYQMKEGTMYTFYDYALLMMILSDNTAADFLYSYVGRDNIYKNVLEPLDLKNTKVDLSCADLFKCYCHTDPEASPTEQFLDYNTGNFLYGDYYKCTQEENDVTTPKDLSKFYKTMYEGRWCDKGISSQILELMKKCQTNSRIPKYLPAGTFVAHKTGTFDRLVNDSGIVYTPAGDYVLTLLYNGNMADEKEYYELNIHGFYGDEILAKLSREIYDIYTSK